MQLESANFCVPTQNNLTALPGRAEGFNVTQCPKACSESSAIAPLFSHVRRWSIIYKVPQGILLQVPWDLVGHTRVSLPDDKRPCRKGKVFCEWTRASVDWKGAVKALIETSCVVTSGRGQRKLLRLLRQSRVEGKSYKFLASYAVERQQRKQRGLPCNYVWNVQSTRLRPPLHLRLEGSSECFEAPYASTSGKQPAVGGA